MKAKSIGVFEAVCAASLVASARTDKAPVAPGWSTIPVLNAQAGRLSIVDLSNFVSGWPAPDFDLVDGDATIEGEFLKFTPSATGMGTIVVCASNRLGTANATLTFEAGELAPKKFAVCVGINEYEEISSLSGCVNDARYMAANLADGGVRIEGFESADADGDGGRFALEVSVDGVSIGSSSAVSGELLLANLAEVLAVEGAETPDPYAFDSEGVETWVCPPVGGRARLEASPPDGADAAFFFRVRVHE